MSVWLGDDAVTIGFGPMNLAYVTNNFSIKAATFHLPAISFMIYQ